MTERPFLRRSARVSQVDDRVVIQYLQDEITLDGSAAELFGKLAGHLDGQHAVENIAQRIDEEPRRVAMLVRQLNQSGVVSLLTGAESEDPTRVSGGAFYQMHRKYCENWLGPVYAHPLWEKIISGQATRAQVLGFAFEKYHYIEGAYEHMAIAAANATPEMMPHLARHFIEEYAHGDIYRVGLRSLFRDEVVLSSQPLPSTRALINFLSESAGRCSFSYYAGNELLQMTENTGDKPAGNAVNEFYDAMRRNYPYTVKVIDSFIAHTHADQKLGHESVFEQMCASVPPLTRAEVRDALDTVRSMAEHLLLFMDGIDVCYARLSAAPRLPCNLLGE